MIVTLRVFGDYSMQVKDPAALITNLVGTVDVANNEAITGWMSDQLLKVMRTHMTIQIVRNGWPILGLSAYTPDIEEEVMAKGNEQLATYGVAIIRMGNFDINLSEQDETQLKTLAKDTAYSRLAGSFQQYAAGEMALGAGAGHGPGRRRGRRGVPRRRARAWAARPPRRLQPGPPPPPGPGFAGGGPATPAQAQAGVECPSCHAGNAGRSQVLRLVRHLAGPAGGGVPELPGRQPRGRQVLRVVRHRMAPAAGRTARRAGPRWRAGGQVLPVVRHRRSAAAAAARQPPAAPPPRASLRSVMPGSSAAHASARR